MADWKQQDPFAGWETEDPFARKKYPIEGDSNWSILPEGEKVKYQTTDPETNARVEGTKSFNQFIPSSKHIPLSQAPKQAPEKNPWDTVGALTQGTKEFVSSAVGMPVDVTNKLLGTLAGRPQGLAETPIGGSESISNAFKNMGITDYNYEKNLVNNIANRIGQYAPNLMFGGLGAAKAGTTPMQAAKAMAPSTLGSGIAAGAAATVAPDNPLAEVTASMLGGFTPALAQSMASKSATLPEAVRKHLSRAAPISKKDLGKEQSAVTTIEEMVQANRDKPFTYKDVNGKEYRSGLPQTVDEAWQAFPQAKARIYNQYNAMQKAAGQEGFVIKGEDVIKGFQNWIASQPQSPTMVGTQEKWLNQIAKKYGNKTWTPDTIEHEMANISAKVRAHQQNPNPNNISGDMFNAAELKVLNAAMDSGISRLEGPGYTSLRSKYAAMKDTESRLEKAATLQYNKSAKEVLSNLPKGWEPGWALEIVGSLASGHPSMALAGLAGIAGPRVRKWLVEPDRNIRKLFEKANKVVPKKQIPPTLENWEGPFVTKPYEGEVTNPRALVPTGRTRDTAPVDAQYREVTPLPQGRNLQLPSPRMPQTVNAPWKPANQLGTTASRQMPVRESVQTKAPFDFQSALKALIDTGMSPSQAQAELLRQIRSEFERRTMRAQ